MICITAAKQARAGTVKVALDIAVDRVDVEHAERIVETKTTALRMQRLFDIPTP